MGVTDALTDLNFLEGLALPLRDGRFRQGCGSAASRGVKAVSFMISNQN
jgi:hypothetical protein